MSLIIAGGGTGGHIYPAIAIAQVLKKSHPQLPIHFIGTKKGLEVKIVPREGFPLHFISAGALNSVGLLTRLISIFLLPIGFFQSLFLILKLRPKVVLGVGGYASGPAMIAAWILRKKTALFESNAYPGLTNRLLGRLVDKAYVNFEVSQKYFKKSEVVGMPVRAGLIPHKINFTPQLKVLIFGGSQGARGINMTVLAAFKKGGDWMSKVQVVHQIGATDFAYFDKEYKALMESTGPRPQVQWHEFLYDMPERYAACDLVVCRAGASTLAELAACQKAAVLVPFPFAADNHQQSNAEALVSRSAAQMILQKDFTVEKFIETLLYFNEHRRDLENYSSRVISFFKPASAEKVAGEIAGMSS